MKVCFVGIGSIAKRHINNLVELYQESKINVQIDALRRAYPKENEINEKITNVYISVDELPSDYDVIFLTNPTEYHTDMLVSLHDKAKHFFIEKPITSIDTISKLKDIVFRKDSVYYVACPLRYNRVIQYIKETVDTKTVNSVRCISSSYLPDWRPGVDYRKTYSAHKDMGGGVSIDLIHEWDYITYLFGMPSSMYSLIGKISKLDIDSDDYAIYIARYDSMIVELHLDYFGRKTIRNIEIYTDDETIVGDIEEGKVTYLKSGKVVDLTEERDSYQKQELLYFMSLLDMKESSSNDVVNAVNVLKLTQGIIDK